MGGLENRIERKKGQATQKEISEGETVRPKRRWNAEENVAANKGDQENESIDKALHFHDHI